LGNNYEFWLDMTFDFWAWISRLDYEYRLARVGLPWEPWYRCFCSDTGRRTADFAGRASRFIPIVFLSLKEWRAVTVALARDHFWLGRRKSEQLQLQPRRRPPAAHSCLHPSPRPTPLAGKVMDPAKEGTRTVRGVPPRSAAAAPLAGLKTMHFWCIASQAPLCASPRLAAAAAWPKHFRPRGMYTQYFFPLSCTQKKEERLCHSNKYLCT